MSFDPSYFTPFISGFFVLAGVWLGGRGANQREEAREKARIKTESTYTAILVVAHLDRLINQCVDVTFDDGTMDGQPPESRAAGALFAIAEPHFDPLALEVEWKSLPPDLLYRILNLPYQLEMLSKKIGETWQFDEPPEYTETIWLRIASYADLGLDICNVARKLRIYAGLPTAESMMDAWNREEQMREQKASVERDRAAWQARVAQHTFSGIPGIGGQPVDQAIPGKG